MSGRQRKALEREVREAIKKSHSEEQLEAMGKHLPAFTRMLVRRAKKLRRVA